MPCYNNHKISRRTRGESCPAGVTFEVNDVSKYGIQRKSSLTNLHLGKENNFTRRRQSLPSAFCDDLNSHERFAKKTSTQSLNYSTLTGGSVDNSFCYKLVEAHKLTHSFVDAPNQHKALNKSHVHNCFDFASLFRHELPLDNTLDDTDSLSQNLTSFSGGLNESQCKIISQGKTRPVIEAKYVNENALNLLKAAENTLSLSSLDETNSFLSRFFQEVNDLEVIDSDGNFSRLVRNSHIADVQDLDSHVERLECHVYGTEVLVENLASQVEIAKREIEMSKQKQENEISDLISLNEEMQTIWTAKESEVREILERFSTYRDAVEADSKEKDEVFAEELRKRELIIKNLQVTKNALEDDLRRQAETFKGIIDDVEKFESTHVQQLVDVNQLVACLLERFSDQEASVVCQSISVKLETSIATIKEKDYTRYVNCLNVTRQAESLFNPEGLNISEIGTESSREDLKRNYRDSNLGKSFSSSVDEGTGYSILSSSDGERNDNTISGSELNNELVNREMFSSEVFSSCALTAAGNAEIYETLEEDFVKLVKGIEEYESDGVINGYMERKTVIKLLEEQRSKYQFLCKEKDDEVQHWIRKHKQDTNDLQSILEEQEMTEAKSSESLAELQSEIEKLRQRNKFLESEVEFAKEQGEDDVCFLKESFQKNLNAQLRRQSQTFLSAEESTKNKLAEMESQNVELRKGNDDLRRQIAEQLTEIKSWVSGILKISEEEYSEECFSITDVLAKLQKIIIENKRTMEELKQELDEQRNKTNEPSSPTDTMLSRSWGGHSWNSVELQKDLCRYCKQAKWQRVLMGSFDLVETGVGVKQDEVERFVDKLNVDESKYRKKHSLKDSLELADDQLEHLQRLSRLQEYDSLETLGEDSLEESDGRNSVGDEDVCDGLSGAEKNPASIADKDPTESCDQTWQGIHVSPRGLQQYSVISEFDGKTENNESAGCENKEVGGEEIVRSQDENWEVEIICDEAVGKDEQCWIEQDNDGQEEDQDRVHVVNLYRSLIVDSSPRGKDFVDSSIHGTSVGRFDDESGAQSGKLNDESGDQTGFKDYAYDNFQGSNKSAIPSNFPLPIPKITVEKDFNENLLETQEQGDGSSGSEYNYFNGISDKAAYLAEACASEDNNTEDNNNNTEDNNINLLDAMDKGTPTDETDLKEMFQPALTDEAFVENIVQPEIKVSESWTISTDPKSSVFEFIGNFENETPPSTACTHCSKLFSETLENLKTNLTEAISSQRKDRENEILEELQNTKTELGEFQSKYEKLESLCEDYRNYVTEYSVNLKHKNEELRKLKLSSGIMKTEIEWLRHALGITRNYAEF